MQGNLATVRSLSKSANPKNKFAPYSTDRLLIVVEDITEDDAFDEVSTPPPTSLLVSLQVYRPRLYDRLFSEYCTVHSHCLALNAFADLII